MGVTTAVLPDELEPYLKILFCGMAAGITSAAAGHYHAHPANRFGRALHELGLTPQQVMPKECRTVLCHGLGLAGIVKHRAGETGQVPIAEDGSRSCAARSGCPGLGAWPQTASAQRGTPRAGGAWTMVSTQW